MIKSFSECFPHTPCGGGLKHTQLAESMRTYILLHFSISIYSHSTWPVYKGTPGPGTVLHSFALRQVSFTSEVFKVCCFPAYHGSFPGPLMALFFS